MIAHPDVAGIDAGFSYAERTSGVCRTGDSGEVIDHTYFDRLSRLQTLGKGSVYSVLAIDAPVLPQDQLDNRTRRCEKVFVLGAFQKRCKCGESHIKGSGQALRRAGVETAHSFATEVSGQPPPTIFPRIFDGKNIVEAFPNAFLGVTLPTSVYESTANRGQKSDWLYEEWKAHQLPARLAKLLDWQRPQFWTAIGENRDHDERAALVCALTAICVLRGKYVAVGQSSEGYFFLPPWEVWDFWAKKALCVNIERLENSLPVEVWIDGTKLQGPGTLASICRDLITT